MSAIARDLIVIGQGAAGLSAALSAGIVVDQHGRRFFDEGGGLVHETWEWFARELQFKTPGSIGYAILDSRLLEIADYPLHPLRGAAVARRHAGRAGEAYRD